MSFFFSFSFPVSPNVLTNSSHRIFCVIFIAPYLSVLILSRLANISTLMTKQVSIPSISVADTAMVLQSTAETRAATTYTFGTWYRIPPLRCRVRSTTYLVHNCTTSPNSSLLFLLHVLWLGWRHMHLFARGGRRVDSHPDGVYLGYVFSTRPTSFRFNQSKIHRDAWLVYQLWESWVVCTNQRPRSKV
ncbi:hypothetical protein BJX63DRAFT_123061 [Aspergillus granulosus]|uniref:Uncharacterized protein n=1 Tax=Aspergillus granulosus TaxID=176169 RepID=A0ABR4I6M7_9EURO